MKATIDNKLTLTEVPTPLLRQVRDRLTFDNPKFIENEQQGRWNGETPEFLRFYERRNQGLAVPRGFIRQLYGIAARFDEPIEFIDRRRVLPDVGFQFNGELKPFQDKAVVAMLKKDFGTLSAPTGSGKTVMGLYMIAQRKQPALIVVHTKELLNQWIDRIETFLGIPRDEVGVVGAGSLDIGPRITVATVQTLYKYADQVSDDIGHLIVDECHRAPSRTFTEAVSAFDCKYMTGLSATPWRRDRLSRLIFWHLGDVHHKVEAGELMDNGDILSATVVTRETDFTPWHDPSVEYSKMLSELTVDGERNRLICKDVAKEARNGSGVCLVLSDRKSHCQALQQVLARDFSLDAEVLTGDVAAGRREDIVSRLNGGKVKTLIATGQLIGEGFDCKGLSTLFLSTPIKFDGRVLQYLGRVLRPAPGKVKASVYDYVDVNVGPLVASAKSRQRVYKRSFDGHR